MYKMADTNTFLPVTKLKGRENYTTWKIAMENLLSLDGLWKAVLGSETSEEKVAKAKAKIVLSVEESLYIHVAKAATAVEAWGNLKRAFEDTGLTRKVGLLRKMTTTRLEKCESMEKYVNEIMSAAHQLAGIGFDINQEWLGTVLLAGLPDRYQPMIMALENSGMAITGDSVKTKLLQESSCFNESKNTVNNDAAYHVKRQSKGAKSNVRSKKVTCWTCGKQGHVANQCSEKGKDDKDKKQHDCDKKKSDASVKVAFLTNSDETVSNASWIIDSAASAHMSPNKKLFKSLIPLEKSQVVVADNKKVCAESKGVITTSVLVNGEVREITIDDALYVPELAVNLLSVRKIANKDYVLIFDKNICKIVDTNSKIVAVAKAKNDIYELIQPINTAYSCKSNNSLVWHRRLGHMNRINMKILRDKYAYGLEFDDPDERPCEVCAKGKQTRRPFFTKMKNEKRASKPLELIHSDVCGPMEEDSIGGSKYFILFIDDYSRKLSIYFLKNKSEALNAFKIYKAYVEKNTGHKILALRSDNGREYVNESFKHFLQEKGIKHQLTIPYTPQQNGLAERSNRTVVEKVRCMLADASLPKKFWAEACSTAVYLINRSPAKRLLGRTPHEVWSGEKPNLSHLKVFGCRATAHIPKELRRKWDEKAKSCLFLGYLEHTKGYRLYDNEAKKVFRSRDVIFYEDATVNTNDEKFFHMISPEDDSEDDQDETDSVGDSSDNSSESFGTPDESKTKSDPNDDGKDRHMQQQEDGDVVVPRRSSRVPKPKRWLDYIAYKTSIEPTDSEPTSVKEALDGIHRKEWNTAMKEELNALTQNKTWELCSPPVGKKILKSRWVYKIKNNPQDELQRFKARLVVKGYEQILGEDYNETFCPVVRFSTLRCLFALAARRDYDIDYLDVITAFLNGDLEEEIYMELPEGYAKKEHGNQVCKLKKALYGLKQGAYAWNKKLDQALRELKFKRSQVDHGLYIRKEDNGRIMYITTYVDDLLLFSNNKDLKRSIMEKLERKFKMRNLGPVSRILGINVQRDRNNRQITLDQKDYIEAVMKKFNVEDCNAVKTLDTNQKLSQDMAPKSDSEASYMKNVPYREALGSIMYAYVATRPDLGCAITKLSSFAENPGKAHWNALKRVLRYLKGTANLQLKLGISDVQKLVGYNDADYAGDIDSRHSTSGYVFLLCGSAISWCSKKQTSVTLSTTDSEFIAIALASQELLWLRNLLNEIESSCVNTPLKLYSDSQSAIKLLHSEKYHARTKHMDVKYNFVKEKIANNVIDVSYVPSVEMIADALTKSVTSEKNKYCNNGMGLDKKLID